MWQTTDKKCEIQWNLPELNLIFVNFCFQNGPMFVLDRFIIITVFTVFRLLTDFVSLYTYEFWLSLCKIVWSSVIVRSSVILLLPLLASISSIGTLSKVRFIQDLVYTVKIKLHINIDCRNFENHKY